MILLDGLSEKDEKKAMEITEQDNVFLDMFRGKLNTTEKDIQRAVERSKFYEEADAGEIEEAVQRINKKLKIINSEYMQWFEILLAFVFMVIAYKWKTK